MEGSTRIFSIFGIDIKLHYSWWIIFILLSWSLSSSFFPQFFPGFTLKTYWMMGITSSLLLFVSVLLHELSHSLVAKIQKINVESITLFFFGGVAGIIKEDIKPRTEFTMAIAGPLFSLFLAGIFFIINISNNNFFFKAITYYLYNLNLMLAIFNLVPGFPLDGGRALRAILYAHYKNLRKATKVASMGGKIFGGFLIFLGLISLINGIGNALWFILLGGFLYFIAGLSYEQIILKETLSKVPISELLTHPLIVSTELNLSELLHKYSKNGDYFLIKDKDDYSLLDLKKIEKISPSAQTRIKIKQLSLPLSKIKRVNIKDTAYNAFNEINKNGLNILPVYDKNKLVGFIQRDRIVRRLILDLKFK